MNSNWHYLDNDEHVYAYLLNGLMKFIDYSLQLVCHRISENYMY